ncbi:endonuclease domain-containing protein [Brevundimonas sp. VNH65]|uniref:endonuclease domain-containing protein n=1 Tax=Brevundimonas sp. VNH65 TaxID=3400917 RepID=UPI003C0FD7ED
MWQSSKETQRAKRLRAAVTKAETILWSHVRDRRFDGWKFRRQSPVAGAVCDFVCADLKLVVELDGGVHRLRPEQDDLRDARLREAGFTVLRSANEAFLSNPNHLFAAIRRHAASLQTPPPHPSRFAAHLLPRGEKDKGLI